MAFCFCLCFCFFWPGSNEPVLLQGGSFQHCAGCSKDPVLLQVASFHSCAACSGQGLTSVCCCQRRASHSYAGCSKGPVLLQVASFHSCAACSGQGLVASFHSCAARVCCCQRRASHSYAGCSKDPVLLQVASFHSCAACSGQGLTSVCCCQRRASHSYAGCSKGLRWLQDPEGNHHIRTLCWFCETAAKAGPCEHSYCALLHEGVLSTAPAAQPRKKGRPRKEHQARPSVPVSGSLLLPGPLLSSSPQPNVSLSPAVLPASESGCTTLLEVLRSAGLESLRKRFVSQGATVSILRDMSYTDFQSFFQLSLVDAHRLKVELAKAGF